MQTHKAEFAYEVPSSGIHIPTILTVRTSKKMQIYYKPIKYSL